MYVNVKIGRRWSVGRHLAVVAASCISVDMNDIESFHMKCQRRILGTRWHDFVRNSEVSLRTGLAPVSDRITRGRNAIFGHGAILPDNTPAHQAMLRQVELSVGRPPDPTRKRPPGRPRAKWTDQLRRDNNKHITTRSSTRSLRSSSAPLLHVPFRRTSFGKRSFSTAAPSVWNSLPVLKHICSPPSMLVNCPVRQRL